MSYDFDKLAYDEIQKLFDLADGLGIDADILGDILHIYLEDGGEYVINKHRASQQIWVSSPISGAGKFSYLEDIEDWKSGHNILFDKISSELKSVN